MYLPEEVPYELAIGKLLEHLPDLSIFFSPAGETYYVDYSDAAFIIWTWDLNLARNVI